MAQASGDDVLKRNSQTRIVRLKNKYKEITNTSGLNPKWERTSVKGFSNKHLGFTKKDLERYEKVRYNEDGTVIVTDDWTTIERPKLPAKYLPNAIIDTLSRGGKQIDRTFYNSEGHQIKQVSNGPHGNPKRHPYSEHGEHAHDVIWELGIIAGRPTRELTEFERKENADIL